MNAHDKKKCSGYITKLCLCEGRKMKRYSENSLPCKQECTDRRHQVAMGTKYFMVGPKICGASEWNILHVTNLAPRILRAPRFFLKKNVHPCFKLRSESRSFQLQSSIATNVIHILTIHFYTIKVQQLVHALISVL